VTDDNAKKKAQDITGKSAEICQNNGSIEDLIIIITIQKQPSPVSSTDLLHRLYYHILYHDAW
jgi:hypothetical protein